MPVYTFNNYYDNKEWGKNGNCHRDNDLPAIEYNNGNKWWFKNGKLHRDGDLPAIKWFHNNKYWYKNGYRYYLNIKTVIIENIIYC